MNRTQQKRVKKAQERQQNTVRALEVFAQHLARDLFVAAWARGEQGEMPCSQLAHVAMEAAVAYVRALQSFEPEPILMPPYAPAQTAAEILDEAEAAGALPRPLAEDEYGEAREIARDLIAEAARERGDEQLDLDAGPEEAP